MHTHHPSAPRGFSIVEILVALAIFIMGIAHIYHQMGENSLRSQRQLKRVQACWLAQQQLEELRAISPEALAALNPPANAQRLPDDPFFCSQTTLTPRPEGGLALSVHVGWNMEPGQPFEAGNFVTAKGSVAP